MVCDDSAYEKVAMEVTALNLIRDRTTIPVPKVRAWGPAASNPLGLGPFIMMDFIDGVSLNHLLRDPNAERPRRVMREDISESDIETLYSRGPIFYFTFSNSTLTGLGAYRHRILKHKALHRPGP